MKESVIEYDERGNVVHYNNFLGDRILVQI